MLVSAHQVNYLPYGGFFAKIMKSDAFMIVSKVQFEKRSWQSRNRILTPNGILCLSVPVLSKNKFHQNICDVQINNDKNWGKKHFLSLKLSYSKSPFWKFYSEFFEHLYKQEWKKLYDLDLAIIKFFIEELGIKTPIYYDENFNLEGSKTDLLISICKEFKAKAYLSNEGAKVYVDITKLNKQGFDHYFCFFKEPKYPQTKLKSRGGGALVNTNNLSMVDMLFALGAQKSKEVLENSLELSFCNENIK